MRSMSGMLKGRCTSLPTESARLDRERESSSALKGRWSAGTTAGAGLRGLRGQGRRAADQRTPKRKKAPCNRL